jgi:hypothetical protein
MRAERDRLGEEAHEAQADAMLLLEAFAIFVARRHHRRHVDVVERRQHRRGVLRRLQPLGDRLAHARHLDALFLAARRTAGGGEARLQQQPEQRRHRARRLAATSTSSLVRRPSLPVPLILEGSTPCSSTRRRTAATASCATGLVGAGPGAAAGAGAARRFALPGAVRSSTAGSRWSPQRHRRLRCVAITLRRPLPYRRRDELLAHHAGDGDGTSTATLSVSRLAIGSSAFTASPGFFQPFAEVASVIDSPSV